MPPAGIHRNYLCRRWQTVGRGSPFLDRWPPGDRIQNHDHKRNVKMIHKFTETGMRILRTCRRQLLIKDRCGKLVTKSEAVLKVWESHFKGEEIK